MSTTNLISGVTNVPESVTLGAYIAPDPSATHLYFEDFNTYLASQFTITNVGSGTLALASGDGGVLLVTNGAADDDHVYAQLVAPGFTFEANKPVWYKCRFKVSDATQSDVYFGLYLLDTSPVASAPADGVYFVKADGSTTINAVQAKTGASTTTTAVGTLADDTYITLGFYYDGGTLFQYFVNDVLVAAPSTLANLPIVALSPSFVIQNGEAVAKNMTIDYMLAAKQRNILSA